MQQNFQEFLQLIEQLRSENGCPYDKKNSRVMDFIIKINKKELIKILFISKYSKPKIPKCVIIYLFNQFIKI